MRLGVVLCLLMLSASPIAAQTSSDARADESKILALENAWNQAQLLHDAKALDSLVADTFVNTDYDGTVSNKAQFLADAKDKSYHADLVTNENVKVHMYRDVAVVIGTYHTKGTNKGKPFEHWGRFTDTWISLNGRWQCVASHTSLLNK